jgi:hypothetical protein
MEPKEVAVPVPVPVQRGQSLAGLSTVQLGVEDLFQQGSSPLPLYRGMPLKGLYKMIVDKELLDTIRDLSNQYTMAKFGTSYNIRSESFCDFYAGNFR